MMEMSMTSLCRLTCALLSSGLMVGPAWSAGPQKGMLPGYLNPHTGEFRTQASGPVADLSPEAAATYTGTFVLKFVVTLKSNIPADWPIQCVQTVTPLDSGGYYYTDSKTVQATRSGSTATCSVIVYYSWVLTSPSDMVSTSYVVVTYGSSSGILQREAVGNLPLVALPANGGTVTRTVNVTL
jgi:hypothetical protein